MREKMLGLLDEYAYSGIVSAPDFDTCGECGYKRGPDPQHHPTCSIGTLRAEINERLQEDVPPVYNCGDLRGMP